MRLYTTKHPRERFNIRWNRRKSAFRLAARGLALYIYPGPLIEWSLVILVTLTAFRLGVIYAYDRVRRRDRVLFRHSDPARTERHGRDSDHRGGKVNELGRLYRKGALYRPGL